MAKESFKVGDIVRNKKPYFGESFKLIVDEDNSQYYLIDGASKYGFFDYPKHKEIVFKHQMAYYKKAKLFEVLLLTIWGWKSRKWGVIWLKNPK
jgi:hypothetical protein